MRLMEDDSDDDRFMTAREEDLFDQGREQERDKWLPLWEAVKELDSEYIFDDYEEDNQATDTAKADMRRVMIELRNQGEK